MTLSGPSVCSSVVAAARAQTPVELRNQTDLESSNLQGERLLNIWLEERLQLENQPEKNQLETGSWLG